MGRLDYIESGTSGVTKPYSAPAPVIKAPIARVSYDQPRISTTSGATGLATPYAGGNPSPITAPSYIAGGSPGRYNGGAPVYNTPITAPQQFQAPAQQFPIPQPIPYEPPRPQFAPGGRQEFNMLSPEQQQARQQNFLGGDSDYTAQVGLYQKALDDFVARITGRIKGFERDAGDATASNIKNEGMSTDSLGADFGARGLSYSGMFVDGRNKMKDRFAEGRNNITKNKDTNVQNAQNERADYESENKINVNNAKRASLLRMAQQQQLLDQNWG